jgi:hypothetical protein
VGKNTEIIFRNGRHYEPVIERRDGELFYSMPVDSSFVSFVVNVPITDADFAVLTTDPTRYTWLYAVLHQPCQLRATHPTPEQFRAHVDAILHTPLAQMESYVAGFPYAAHTFQQILDARQSSA